MDKAERDCLMTPFAQIGNKLHLLLHTGQLLMENGADSDRTVRDMMRAAALISRFMTQSRRNSRIFR